MLKVKGYRLFSLTLSDWNWTDGPEANKVLYEPGKGLVKGMDLSLLNVVILGMEAEMSNGWTAHTLDGGLSCQFEHT